MEFEFKSAHLIAIGGSVMHNVAIMLKNKGVEVTGSDDKIFEPSKTRLANAGLLPETMGWNPDRITKDTDLVILGMHAKADNPELQKAQELNVPIVSFPNFVFNYSQNKQRIVIAGSHGKTTITSIIMHVLKHHNKKFDYLVGAQIEGFENMVKLSDDAPIIIIEGDEYGTSPLDPTPKLINYKHHIGVISGIAWDHANLFPSLEEYVKQFDTFADQTPKSGKLIFPEDDDVAAVICKKEREDVTPLGYGPHKHIVENGKTFLINESEKIPVNVFGKHNMLNISAAKILCNQLAITDAMFYEAITKFPGSQNRLEKICSNNQNIVFSDFAHAPSKLKATSEAVKTQFKSKKNIAVFELHTYSSLNKNFLPEYKGTFNSPDKAIVYFNPETLSKKGYDALSTTEVIEAFDRNDLIVLTDAELLKNEIIASKDNETVLLLMSSGNLGGLDINKIAKEFCS